MSERNSRSLAIADLTLTPEQFADLRQLSELYFRRLTDGSSLTSREWIDARETLASVATDLLDEIQAADERGTEIASVLRGIVREQLGSDFVDPEVGGALAVAAHMDALELARFLAAELRDPGSWTPDSGMPVTAEGEQP